MPYTILKRTKVLLKLTIKVGILVLEEYLCKIGLTDCGSEFFDSRRFSLNV